MQKVIVAIFILFGLGAYSSTTAKPPNKCTDVRVNCSISCTNPKTEKACLAKCKAAEARCLTGDTRIDIRTFPIVSGKDGSATISGPSNGTVVGPHMRVFGADKMIDTSGAATATMPGAGAVRSAVTNGGVISTNGSVVTNSPVIVKRRAVVTGGAAGPFSAPGTAKAKVQ